VELSVKDVVRLTGGRLRGGELSGAVCGVSTDTRSLRRGELFVALKGERFDGHEFLGSAVERGAAGLVVSGQVPTKLTEGVATIEVGDTLDALGRLAAGYRRRLTGKVIGITGSCGKTALKEMLGQVLARHIKGRAPAASYNNQIGVPLTLLGAEEDDRYVILEMGTNTPGEIAYLTSIGCPEIGVVTVIAEVHLVGLGNLDSIAQEKSALVHSLPTDGLAVLNADDTRVSDMQTRARVVTFGLDPGADYGAQDVEVSTQGLRFLANGKIPVCIPVLARYYAGLAMATMAVAEALGVELEEVAEDLSSYQLPAMRLVKEVLGDVVLINDAYNANYRSCVTALEVLKLWPDRRKVIFFGDMLELGPEGRRIHRSLGAEVANVGVRKLITVGTESRQIRAGAIDAGFDGGAAAHFETSEEAASQAGGLVVAGDVVLVKGSRKMQMERIAESLRAEFGK